MTTETLELGSMRSGSVPLAVLRITIGVIVLATWADNLANNLYTSAGLVDRIEWLFAPVADGGNGSSLDVVRRLTNWIVVPRAGLFAGLQLAVELLIGISMLFGVLTRLGSLVAAAFFTAQFFAYFGGEVWIWSYVLLVVTSVTVFWGYGGRRLGVDQWLRSAVGEPPGDLLW